MSDKDVYNQVLARLVLRQDLCAREQIVGALSQVGPDKDLGQVLIEQGALDFENYLKFHNYIHKLFTAPGGRDKIREILASSSAPAALANAPARPAAAPAQVAPVARSAVQDLPSAAPAAPVAPVQPALAAQLRSLRSPACPPCSADPPAMASCKYPSPRRLVRSRPLRKFWFLHVSTRPPTSTSAQAAPFFYDVTPSFDRYPSSP